MSSSQILGHIRQLWRYPVKSMRGEALARLAVAARGAAGDRLFALRDAEGKLGSGKASKRFRQIEGLLDFAARTVGDKVIIRIPDGRELAAGEPTIDHALSDACGVPVTLARAEAAPYYDAAALHVLSDASVAWVRARLPGVALDERRFRPNLVVATECAEGLVEQEWIGRSIAIGDSVVIKAARPTVRCVMTTLPQGELGAAPAVLTTINRGAAAALGIYAEVLRPGTLRIGDELRFA
jgi:uncharacterized protein YcbX